MTPKPQGSAISPCQGRHSRAAHTNWLGEWQILLLRIKHIYCIINLTNISSSLPLPYPSSLQHSSSNKTFLSKLFGCGCFTSHKQQQQHRTAACRPVTPILTDQEQVHYSAQLPHLTSPHLTSPHHRWHTVSAKKTNTCPVAQHRLTAMRMPPCTPLLSPPF